MTWVCVMGDHNLNMSDDRKRDFAKALKLFRADTADPAIVEANVTRMLRLVLHYILPQGKLLEHIPRGFVLVMECQSPGLWDCYVAVHVDDGRICENIDDDAKVPGNLSDGW